MLFGPKCILSRNEGSSWPCLVTRLCRPPMPDTWDKLLSRTRRQIQHPRAFSTVELLWGPGAHSGSSADSEKRLSGCVTLLFEGRALSQVSPFQMGWCWGPLTSCPSSSREGPGLLEHWPHVPLGREAPSGWSFSSPALSCPVKTVWRTSNRRRLMLANSSEHLELGW